MPAQPFFMRKRLCWRLAPHGDETDAVSIVKLEKLHFSFVFAPAFLYICT